MTTRHAIWLWEPGDPPAELTCKVCGAGYWHDAPGRKRETCSAECHVENRRQRERRLAARQKETAR